MKATPTSPRARARLAGALYLISAAPAGFSVYVFLKLVVRGNPAATAANILASEGLFRLGLVADIVGILFYVGAVLLLYETFKSVSRGLALMFLCLSVIGTGIQALDSLQDLAALVLLKGGASTTALTTDQAQALAFVFVRLHLLSYDLAMVFFGSASVMMGFLILRSTFLPRILGAVMMVAGLGWLTFLSPPLANLLSPWNMAPGILGEALLTLWLLAMGVSDQRWKEQASTG